MKEDARRARKLLMDWYATARRDLPWRRTRDPWQILVSEFMLQQTRVSAVIPYYEKFLERFPAPATLAEADERELLAVWSGLGYYARARNLKRAAEAIRDAGSFPSSYEEIRELPGVGDYTAAAVASMVFALPHAVADGNVVRVLSRVAAEKGDVRSASVRARLMEAAQRLLDKRKPGEFNQALMELGATVCLPRNPQCLLCPWRDLCQARAEGIQGELPVKPARKEPVWLAVTLLVARKDGKILLKQRASHEMRLAGFWELPEAREAPTARVGKRLGSFRHSITHHEYTIEVRKAEVGRAPKGCSWVALKDLETLPLATTARKALEIAKPVSD